MERADALEFLAAEQDKLSHRLECALKVPCRAYYEKLSEAYIQAIFALKANMPHLPGLSSIRVEQCIDAAPTIEQAERINPKPLTLDELRERDGKPVWVEEITPEQIDGNYWGIVDVDFVCPRSLGIGAIISTATDGKSKFAITPFSDYNKTHVAYDYPPKEDKPCI